MLKSKDFFKMYGVSDWLQSHHFKKLMRSGIPQHTFFKINQNTQAATSSDKIFKKIFKVLALKNVHC